MVQAETVYVSACVNRHAHCADWSGQVVCYGSKNAVVLYSLQEQKVINILNGHSDQVNSVHWIDDENQLLISASSDKRAIIWQGVNENGIEYSPLHKLSGHGEGVTIARSVSLPCGLISITVSTDLNLVLWRDSNQVIKHPLKNFIYDVKLFTHDILGPDILLIAFAGADEIVHIYSFNTKNDEFSKIHQLVGHQDWIRAVDITADSSQILIASSAQDTFIRIWKLIPNFENVQPKINETSIQLGSKNYLVKLETVLAGHENWVYGLKWVKKENDEAPFQIVSASMDKTMIVWEEPKNQEDAPDLWLEKIRVGEVGGNLAGFIGCTIDRALVNPTSLICYSFHGALHLWQQNKSNNLWEPRMIAGGHFGPVTDLSWEAHHGRYLLSCSLDETTRLHACDKNGIWHESARPQIHGYEINCIASLNPLSFVSGADEKVLRVFRGTRYFLESFKSITGQALVDSKKADMNFAEFACVPPLGLSNRAIFEPGKEDIGETLSSNFAPKILSEPPPEDVLLQNTLWPEVNKLYGHGYEIFAVAVNSTGNLIASACKAAKAQHAKLFLWRFDAETDEWSSFCQLDGHQLTVTRIRFSPNDEYILTVSRDRTWCLYEKYEKSYRNYASTEKTTGIHTRIIWDCAWTPSSDKFVTVSRDGKAIFWNPRPNDKPFEAYKDSILSLSESINSVDIAQKLLEDQSLLTALGMESGLVSLYSWSPESAWVLLHNINQCHHLPVKFLRFKPQGTSEKEKEDKIVLATCGADHMLKVIQLV